MTLAEISQISQTLGSAAVVASLIFVGVQILQNTKATRAASHHAVSEALNQVNLLWARNSEVTRIWLSGLSDRRALTPEDRWRFDATVRAYLHVCETMYTQADLGAGDFGIVMAEEGGIKTVFSSVGVREWWAENPFGFSPMFRNYVERLINPVSEPGYQSASARGVADGEPVGDNRLRPNGLTGHQLHDELDCRPTVPRGYINESSTSPSSSTARHRNLRLRLEKRMGAARNW